MRFEAAAQALPGQEPGAAKIEVEKTKDAAAGKAACEFFQSAEPAGHKTGAGNRADRGAGDNVRLQACFDEGLQHPDMSPASRRAPTEGDANQRSRHAVRPESCRVVPGGLRRRGRSKSFLGLGRCGVRVPFATRLFGSL